MNLYGVFGLRQEKKHIEKIPRTEKEHLQTLLQGFEKDDMLSYEHMPARQIRLTKPDRTMYVSITPEEYILEEKRRDFAFISAPTYATATTSAGRFWLLTNIYYIVLSLKNEVYYCDTDSIFTNAVIHSNDAMGGFKHEGFYKKAFFFAPKTYILISEDSLEITAKGTGNALVKDMIVQTYRTDFTQIRRMAIANDRKTAKIPIRDGWLEYTKEDVEYMKYWRPIIEKAIAEIENEKIRQDLKSLL